MLYMNKGKHGIFEWKDYNKINNFEYRAFHDVLEVEVDIIYDRLDQKWFWCVMYDRNLKSGIDATYYAKRGSSNSKEKCFARINEWIATKPLKKTYGPKICPTCGK